MVTINTRNTSDIEKSDLYNTAESTLRDWYRSMSYKHLQHPSQSLASVLLNFQSSNAYGGVVSDPIEGAQLDER